MKLRNLDEVTAEKQKEKTNKTSDKTYGLEFVPSEDTVASIKEAIKLSKTSDGAYDNFEDLWKDLMFDED